jgi:hypothetical protein
MKNVSVFILMAFLWSCGAGEVEMVYNLTPELQVSWDKVNGQLIFPSPGGGRMLVQESRGDSDTIDISSVGYVDLRIPGKYSFYLTENGKKVGNTIQVERMIHDGINNGIVTHTSTDAPHNRKGILNDGIAGAEDITAGEWAGWKNKNAVIEYEFIEDQPVTYVSLRYRDDLENNIYPPSTIDIEGSVDGEHWVKMVSRNIEAPGYPITVEQLPIVGTFKKIRINVGNYTTSKEYVSWLLIDEIFVSKY